MRKVLAILAVVALAALAVVALPGCGALTDRENAAAARLEAEAALERARGDAAAERAQAEAEKMRAETDALAERASIRQVERDAALERGLLLLVVLALMLTFGAILVGVAALTRRSSMGVDPVVVALLERQDRRLNELERAQWHSIAESQRRLAVGEHRVVVYDLKGDGVG